MVADVCDIESATRERLLAREKAIRAKIPAKEGYIGVLPDHAPLLSELGIGAMTYTTPEDQRFSLAVRGGFFEINNKLGRVLITIGGKAPENDCAPAGKGLNDAPEAIIY